MITMQSNSNLSVVVFSIFGMKLRVVISKLFKFLHKMLYILPPFALLSLCCSVGWPDEVLGYTIKLIKYSRLDVIKFNVRKLFILL